jgi:iron complex transport system substrate-binding protein
MSADDVSRLEYRVVMRVVSLLPSATEHVCAVGARDLLVGVSHECDFPGDVVGLPILTRCRTSLGRDSLAIDRSIRNLLQRAVAVYEVDVDALAAVRPDVIVTQDLCDVCAVSYDDVCAAARGLGNPDLRIVNLRPTRLADIWDDLRKVGAALGRDPQPVLEALHARVEAVRARAAGLPRRKVLTIEWLEPVMVGGTWMPELVEIAGGEPLVTGPGQHAPTLTDDALGALDPDVVLIKPCGFDIARTLGEVRRVESLAALFPRARTYVADGNAFFNRPGPRIVESLEILAAATHPEVFGDDERLVTVLP